MENPLITASRMGNLNTVLSLLNQGANVHTQDDYALRWAAENVHLEIIHLLLSRGANVNVLSPDLQITYRETPVVLSQEDYQIILPFIVSILDNEIIASDRKKYIF